MKSKRGVKEKSPLLINEGRSIETSKYYAVTSARLTRADEKNKYRKYHFLRPIGFLDVLFGVIGVISSGVQGIVPLAFYYWFGKLIDDDSDSTHHLSVKIKETSFYFFIIAAVAGISTWISTGIFGYVGERITTRIRKDLFSAITMQDVTYFDRTQTGTLLTRLSEDAANVKNVFGLKLGQASTSMMQCCGGIGFAFYMSWKLTLVMLGTAPILMIAITVQGIMTSYFTKQDSAASSKANATAEEVITNIKTVRSFSTEEKESTRFAHSLQRLLFLAKLRLGTQGVGQGFATMMIWAAAALAFFYGGVLVGEDDLTLGKLVTVFGMMLFGVIGLSVAMSVLPDVFKCRASFKLIKEVIKRQPEINFRGGEAPEIHGCIEMKGINFTYATRDIRVIKDFSLRVDVGQTIALVGESGCGKSTIISLLERFYEPQEGRILIDGVALEDIEPYYYHHHVALVAQEPVLFATTIRENITYGREGHVSQEEIEAAARMANAHDFIMTLPNGYDTEVGERGTQLSGGQKQRVAIARAVLMDPKILFLDEATSALDTESEALVQEALEKLMKGRTSIVIAHRLSTVRSADRIYVIEKGEIVEEGTHDDLLESAGVYAKLASKQMNIFDEGSSGSTHNGEYYDDDDDDDDDDDAHNDDDEFSDSSGHD